MRNKKLGLGIALIATVGLFSSCEIKWDEIDPSQESTISISTSIATSTLECIGENVLNLSVKTDADLVIVNIDADTTKIAREAINEVHCTLGTEYYTFTEMPIVIKDTLAESGSYTLKILVKYTVGDSVAETTYSGSLTVTSKTTNSESNF